jgi:energy-coupling factor transporter ATP-binding protein EcfA2
MILYLISGYAGAGKSTVATQIQSLIPDSERTAFAKAVKDFVSQRYGVERYLLDTQAGKQTIVESTHGIFTVRDLLILFAESLKRKNGEDIWANAVVSDIRSKPDIQNWIIEDWRFPNEYTVLLNAFPETTIRRIRIVTTNVQPFNSAEKAMDAQLVDYTIDNTTHDCKDAI